MAFPSSHKTQKDSKNPLGEEQQEPRKERDWLELGLGFGTDEGGKLSPQDEWIPVSIVASASSSSQQRQAHSSLERQIGQGFGLGLDLELRAGLGFDNECVRDVDVITPNKYHSFWWQNEEHKDEDNYNHMLSWPWHMEYSGSFLGLHDHWEMPVPNDSHNYSTTRARPHPGLWFTLQSSTNRDGEALPQIPKAYIRVKDESVTVFMVKKYLVRKLGLANEAEIDLSCMGQNLSQTQTLKQVRDSIWLPQLVDSAESMNLSKENVHGSALSHLMSLQYGKRSSLGLDL